MPNTALYRGIVSIIKKEINGISKVWPTQRAEPGGWGTSVNTKLSYVAAQEPHFDFNLAVARCWRGTHLAVICWRSHARNRFLWLSWIIRWMYRIVNMHGIGGSCGMRHYLQRCRHMCVNGHACYARVTSHMFSYSWNSMREYMNHDCWTRLLPYWSHH